MTAPRPCRIPLGSDRICGYFQVIIFSFTVSNHSEMRGLRIRIVEIRDAVLRLIDNLDCVETLSDFQASFLGNGDRSRSHGCSGWNFNRVRAFKSVVSESKIALQVTLRYNLCSCVQGRLNGRVTQSVGVILLASSGVRLLEEHQTRSLINLPIFS